MKICIVLGTRPEIIKMASLIRECERRKLDFFILHTGQHYSKELDEQIFDDLELPKSRYNLGVGGQPYRKQVGIMIKEISKILEKEKPDVVIVQGDTISVLAGTLAAKKFNIKVAHHEAGLRSHDITMLEETNRIITDHVSDFLFAPTPDALKNLHQEGREPDKIFLTGNTIVDTVNQNLEIANKKSDALRKLKIEPNEYILATIHRAENVDKDDKLRNILEGLKMVQTNLNLPLIFPIHPRTKNKIKEFNIELPENLTLIDPLGFLEFLQLEANAKVALTDSGGVQEECFILKVPCITVRENTERPETIEYKANILAGTEPKKILECTLHMIANYPKLNNWENPFGDGNAAKRIMEILTKFL